MADEFPLPRSGFKVLRLILIGYLHEGGRDRKAVGPADVGRTVGMDQTNVSRNNAFLAGVGLIESEQRGKWRLSEGGVAVAQALEYEAADELREALGSVLRANAFVQRLLTFVRSRGTIEEPQLVQHIARTAGVPRKSEFITGARTLIDLMVEGGLLTEVGGVLQATPPRETVLSHGTDAVIAEPPPRSRTGAERSVAGAVSLTLNVNLSTGDLEDVDALAARLKRLLDALSGAAPSADAD